LDFPNKEASDQRFLVFMIDRYANDASTYLISIENGANSSSKFMRKVKALELDARIKLKRLYLAHEL